MGTKEMIKIVDEQGTEKEVEAVSFFTLKSNNKSNFIMLNFINSLTLLLINPLINKSKINLKLINFICPNFNSDTDAFYFLE